MAAAEKHASGACSIPRGLFSFAASDGRRPCRLDWSAIDPHENFVKLPASITKTKRARHIEISENCRAWLALYVKETGTVFPYSGNVLAIRNGTK